ncbi:ZP3 protein, partial [Polypterus senegalus]
MWCKGQSAVVLLLFFLCDAFAQPRFKGRKLIAKQQKPAVVLYANPIEPRAGSPQTVTAQCTDSEVIVTISPDLLGIQKPVQPSDLSMGGCGVTSPAGAQPFVIEAPLQGCGSTVEMQGAEIVYSFTLDYNPSPIDGLPIVRTNPAVVQIECHYNRCFLDSQLTGSNSHFMSPRVAQSIIQFQLDAFRFYGLTTSSIAVVLLLFFLCDAFAQPSFKGRHVIAKQQKPAVVHYANPIEPKAGAPQTVTARCTDSEVIVTISPDLLGIQKPVQPSDLSMGGCGVTSPAGAQPFVIEAPLQGCGSTVEMHGAEIVYTFTLDYNPSPIDGLPIVRTNPAVVQIECHYNRCFLDSQLTGSNSQFMSPRVAQSVIQFQLDAFRFYGLTTSSIFITCRLKVTLASADVDPLNKDCSYNSALSQWSSVDGNDGVCSCCDTNCANPPPFRRGSGAPRYRPRRAMYTFTLDYNPSPIDGLPIVRTNPAVVQIECHYNRCFLDSQLTGSNSQFVSPRVAQSVMQFQLDAFRFYGLTTSSEPLERSSDDIEKNPMPNRGLLSKYTTVKRNVGLKEEDCDWESTQVKQESLSIKEEDSEWVPLRIKEGSVEAFAITDRQKNETVNSVKEEGFILESDSQCFNPKEEVLELGFSPCSPSSLQPHSVDVKMESSLPEKAAGSSHCGEELEKRKNDQLIKLDQLSPPSKILQPPWFPQGRVWEPLHTLRMKLDQYS